MSQHKKGVYIEVPLDLTQQQWEWLEDMSTKHKLPSMSKAVRCCINCVASRGDIAKDEAIISSGQSTNNDDEGATVEKFVELSTEQLVWMKNKQKDALRVVVQSCMEMEEYTVFGIIRCKTSIAACGGAQDAVRNIGEIFGKNDGDVEVEENVDISKGCGCASGQK
mmetsp:Transcript_28153/g.51973  ORF Transcript_28153/g.51973 Transcript_28153/m.51973 type:complete len:166 (-) Transcript_28153:373-870(-)